MSDIDISPTSRDRMAPRLTVAAGLLVMVGAGLFASRYTPFWFDPDEGCALLGRCVTAESEAMLELAWWVVAAGFAVVLAGLVAGFGSLRPPPTAPVLRLPAPVRALAAGVIGFALCSVLGLVVLVAALTAEQLVPAALCVLWLVQARTVLALDHAAAPAHRSAGRRWAGALAASALGLVAMALLATGAVEGQLLPAVDAVVLACAVQIDGVLPARDEPVGRARLAAVAVTVLVVLAFAGHLLSESSREVYVAPPTPAAPPMAARPPGPSPAPSPTPAAPPPSPVAPLPVVVDAAVPCSPDALVWSTTGWDAAMGTRFVGVVATHHGPAACYLEGFADVTIAQGGRALQLVVEPGSVDQPSKPVTARRVGVAPGGSASFPLFWKGYGTAADQRTPQSLTVALPGIGPVDVPLTDGPAPFDLVDGGKLQVGPWEPWVR